MHLNFYLLDAQKEKERIQKMYEEVQEKYTNAIN